MTETGHWGPGDHTVYREVLRGNVWSAKPVTVVQDTIDLVAGLVRREIAGRTFIMYAFNGQAPGPLLRIKQNATLVVNFTNNIEFPTTLRWHGVRLDNEFDGVPGLTQRPVRPGRRSA